MHPLWLSRKIILVDWGDFTTSEHITYLPKLAVSQPNPNTASRLFFGTFPDLFRNHPAGSCTYAFHTYPIHILVSIHESRKLYSPSIPVDIHPAALNQKAGAYNMQMVHSWTFWSVWSSGINQESDILKCDFNIASNTTPAKCRSRDKPNIGQNLV